MKQQLAKEASKPVVDELNHYQEMSECLSRDVDAYLEPMEGTGLKAD